MIVAEPAPAQLFATMCAHIANRGAAALQAARTIAELRDVTMRELAPAVTVLHLFLSSSKPVLRFAAVRILNSVSMTHPTAVANCNIELEQLMTDTNRSIAVYAITTLLKTGSEASVERLLKQIRAFMADIADDFKVVVVDAIRALCLKYPSKHRALLAFLSHMLREEGGYEFKRAIVDAMLGLLSRIPEAREAGLLHLAEFIEDCEFTQLATQARPLAPLTLRPFDASAVPSHRPSPPPGHGRASCCSQIGLPLVRCSCSCLFHCSLSPFTAHARSCTAHARCLAQVLHLLGEMAPDTADPARFVRFIYNRVVLENATVRAAATSALAAICARCEPLRDRILVLLRRSLADNDDEVRSSLMASPSPTHLACPSPNSLANNDREVRTCLIQGLAAANLPSLFPSPPALPSQLPRR